MDVQLRQICFVQSTDEWRPHVSVVSLLECLFDVYSKLVSFAWFTPALDLDFAAVHVAVLNQILFTRSPHHCSDVVESLQEKEHMVQEAGVESSAHACHWLTGKWKAAEEGHCERSPTNRSIAVGYDMIVSPCSVTSR